MKMSIDYKDLHEKMMKYRDYVIVTMLENAPKVDIQPAETLMERYQDNLKLREKAKEIVVDDFQKVLTMIVREGKL